MDRKDAIAWVVWLCHDLLRKSQVNTLSFLVAAMIGCERASLGALGRELARQVEGAAKHTIKRAWRFTCNRRVEPAQAMPLMMTRLWRRKLKWHRKRPDRRPLLMSLDWTKVRRFHTLMAAVVVQGRALPLCWESYADKVQGKSQNALEEAMLLRIKAALPAGVKGVILADRGFGRAALAQCCQRLGLDYLVRVRGDVKVRTGRWQGRLDQYPIRRGQCRGFTDVAYRHDGVVNTHLVVRWKRGLPPDKDQPWFLITSLAVGGKGRNQELSDLYALRFDIEELFRDQKNPHLGWSLGKTRITRADRLDRMLLILALAYVLLVALGLWGREHRSPRLWCTNNRRHELSAFAIGRAMRSRLRRPWPELIDLLLRSLATPEGNWG